jgi:chromosome segregation ATPase
MTKTGSTVDASKEKVQALSEMIKDLERQLDQLLAINQAVEKERDTERKLRIQAQEKLTAGLEDAAERADRNAMDAQALRSETAALQDERMRLSTEVEHLKREHNKQNEELEDLRRQLGQLRGSREDTLAELQTLESQFERAMKIITEQKVAAQVLDEERKDLTGRIKLLQERLNELESENASLTSESEESRRTLAVIRRSLTEAYLKRSGE